MVDSYYPLVSVIIPNYNHSDYLKQRIDSVLSQTYPNFEVIILDDKSTDNSVDIINQYKSHEKVTHIVVNSENSGSTFLQWNRGINLAAGEVIWIAESDDYCSPNFLEECMNQYRSLQNVSVVYCTSEYVDANNNDLGTYNPEKLLIHPYNGIEFIKENLAYGCAIWNASSAIFNKSYAEKIDKKYQSYKACGDKLFWIEMAELGDVVHVNKIMNYFRQHRKKVSPRKFRDGTSLTEERMIYDYQINKGYLRGFRGLFIQQMYIRKILNGNFENEDIREKLLCLWKAKSKFKRSCLALFSRIYQYQRLYIQHKNPI